MPGFYGCSLAHVLSGLQPTQSTIDHLPQLHIKRLNLKGIQTFSYHGAQIISRIALSLYAAVLHAQPQQHTAETRNNHVH